MKKFLVKTIFMFVFIIIMGIAWILLCSGINQMLCDTGYDWADYFTTPSLWIKQFKYPLVWVGIIIEYFDMTMINTWWKKI